MHVSWWQLQIINNKNIIIMDIFNSNRKLEELVMYGIDWGLFLRHNMDGPIAPFIYLKEGNDINIRMLMTDGDPMEYAKKIIEKEDKPFQQFIIGLEGYLRNEKGERTDAIIINGFDKTQEKGVTLAQMFLPIENGGFKKIDKVIFLGNPELIIPIEKNLNPDYSVDEIGFNAIAIKNEENNLTKYLAVFTHDNPSIIANAIKRFLRSKFSSENSNELSGEFDIEIPDNCVKNFDLLSFVVKNAIQEELQEEVTKKWTEKNNRKIKITAKYNGKILFQTDNQTMNDSNDLSKYTISELDNFFNEILKIPNARTNIEALTKMSNLLEEYKKRKIETPDKRKVVSTKRNNSSKKWWEFWK